MKKLFRLAAIATAITALCSCGNSGSSSVDYLPCKLEEGQDYGFVDNKGNVFLSDEFKTMPSNVVEGVFSVKEEKSYSLYAFGKKKPKLIREGLIAIGVPKNGILPIVKEDSCIEIINLKGKTVLELSQFEGNNVVYCAPSFNEYGWLEVYTIDGNKKIHKILIDKKGKVVFSPKSNYDAKEWTLVNKKLIFGKKAEQEGEKQHGIAFNLKNEELSSWSKIAKLINDGEFITDGYITVTKNDKLYIYDPNGNGEEELVKCPDKVSSIKSIKDEKFVFYDKNSKSYGVMDFKGETIISAKYNSITILDNSYLVNKDNKKYIILNKAGEKDRELDWKKIEFVEGFGWIGSEGNDHYLLDDKFEPLHKTEIYDIDNNSTDDDILSSDIYSSENSSSSFSSDSYLTPSIELEMEMANDEPEEEDFEESENWW